MATSFKKSQIAVAVFALSMSTSPIVAAEDGFEDFWSSMKTAFSGYETQQLSAFEQYTKDHRMAFEQFKQQLVGKWGFAEVSTPSKAVIYSHDLNNKVVVDYQNHKIRVSNNTDKNLTKAEIRQILDEALRTPITDIKQNTLPVNPKLIELNEKNRQLENESAQQSQENAKLNQQKALLAQQNAKLQQQLKQLQQQQAELTQGQTQLSQDNRALLEQQQALLTKQKALIAQIEQLDQEKQALNKENNSLRQHQTQLAKTEQSLQQQQIQLEQTNAALAAEKAKLVAQAAKLAEINNNNQQIQNEALEQIQAQKQSLEQTVAELEAKQSEQAEILDKLRDQQSEQHATVAALTEAEQTLEEQKQALLEENQLLEQEKQQLTDQAAQLIADNQALQQENNDLQTQPTISNEQVAPNTNPQPSETTAPTTPPATIADSLNLDAKDINDIADELAKEQAQVDNKTIAKEVIEDIKQTEQTLDKQTDLDTSEQSKQLDQEYAKTLQDEREKLEQDPTAIQTNAKQVNVSPKRVNRAKPYQSQVKKQAQQLKLSESLLLAVMETESSFNPLARSPIPAFGLMQVVPNSAGVDVNKRLNGIETAPSEASLYHPETNIQFGSTYFDLLFNRYFKNVDDPTSRFYCAISAYNTGPGNVARTFNGDSMSLSKAQKKINQMTPEQVKQHLLKNLPYEETRKYLGKVIKAEAFFASHI